jgi:hypothetical protein
MSARREDGIFIGHFVDAHSSFMLSMPNAVLDVLRGNRS